MANNVPWYNQNSIYGGSSQYEPSYNPYLDPNNYANPKKNNFSIEMLPYAQGLSTVMGWTGDIMDQYQQNQRLQDLQYDSRLNYSDVKNNQNLINSYTNNNFAQIKDPNTINRISSIAGDTTSGALSGAGIGGPIGAIIGGAAGLVKGIGQDIMGQVSRNKARDIQANQLGIQTNNFYDTSYMNNQRELRNNMYSYAQGGELEGLNGVNRFNNGGTHEESVLGGIPQGIAPDNQPNLVEEGEVRIGDNIYSKRIKLTASSLTNNHLNPKYAGMSAADVMMKYQKESEERPNDPISMDTQNDYADRVYAAQEEVKAKQEMNRFKKLVNQMSPEEQMNLLSSLNQGMQQPQYEAPNMQSDMMQQDPNMMNQQLQQGIMALGGHLFDGGGSMKSSGRGIRGINLDSKQINQIKKNLKKQGFKIISENNGIIQLKNIKTNNHTIGGIYNLHLNDGSLRTVISNEEIPLAPQSYIDNNGNIHIVPENYRKLYNTLSEGFDDNTLYDKVMGINTKSGPISRFEGDNEPYYDNYNIESPFVNNQIPIDNNGLEYSLEDSYPENIPPKTLPYSRISRLPINLSINSNDDIPSHIKVDVPPSLWEQLGLADLSSEAPIGLAAKWDMDDYYNYVKNFKGSKGKGNTKYTYTISNGTGRDKAGTGGFDDNGTLFNEYTSDIIGLYDTLYKNEDFQKYLKWLAENTDKKYDDYPEYNNLPKEYFDLRSLNILNDNTGRKLVRSSVIPYNDNTYGVLSRDATRTGYYNSLKEFNTVRNDGKNGIWQVTPYRVNNINKYHYLNEAGNWEEVDNYDDKLWEIDDTQGIRYSPVNDNHERLIHQILRKKSIEPSNNKDTTDVEDPNPNTSINPNQNINLDDYVKKTDWTTPLSMLAPALASSLTPTNYEWSDRMRNYASQLKPISAPQLASYERYNPYDVNVANNQAMAQEAANLRNINNSTLNSGTRTAQTLALNQQFQNANSLRNIQAQQANDAERARVNQINRTIDQANSQLVQSYDSLNNNIMQERIKQLNLAEQMGDTLESATSQARSSAWSNALQNINNWQNSQKINALTALYAMNNSNTLPNLEFLTPFLEQLGYTYKTNKTE